MNLAIIGSRSFTNLKVAEEAFRRYCCVKDWYLKEGDSDVLEEAKRFWWNGVYIDVVKKAGV